MTDQVINIDGAVYEAIERMREIGVYMLAPGLVSKKAKEFGYYELYDWIQNHVAEYVIGSTGRFERESEQ